MQVDINKTKSRSYNYFLRNFHVGLRILAVIFSTRIIDEYESCPQTISKFVFPLAITLTTLNLGFMIYFICRKNFPRNEFFVFLSVNVIICSVIGLLTYSYFNSGARCKKNMILQTYIVLEVIFSIPICLLILFGKFEWEQRYTNTPGNLIWTILIIEFAHDMSFILQIQIVAWITATISVASLSLNVTSLVTGITPFVKKIILIEWIVALVLMVICILIASLAFLNNYFLQQYANQILSNICLKYILVSIIDIGFWVWGLLTLTYENGDFVRNAIIYGNYAAFSHQDQQYQVQHHIYGNHFSIKNHNDLLE